MPSRQPPAHLRLPRTSLHSYGIPESNKRPCAPFHDHPQSEFATSSLRATRTIVQAKHANHIPGNPYREDAARLRYHCRESANIRGAAARIPSTSQVLATLRLIRLAEWLAVTR